MVPFHVTTHVGVGLVIPVHYQFMHSSNVLVSYFRSFAKILSNFLCLFMNFFFNKIDKLFASTIVKECYLSVSHDLPRERVNCHSSNAKVVFFEIVSVGICLQSLF